MFTLPLAQFDLQRTDSLIVCFRAGVLRASGFFLRLEEALEFLNFAGELLLARFLRGFHLGHQVLLLHDLVAQL